ncbi:peptidylprolyl isomerase [Winogradskyella psychrotolerans]|uniref:peptidylprolyl isomerase n=1 Tax=Winogradskyella psychrotolerans TaxID=1344585 RepID=UPI001C0723C0|nr:peptidylprolyl isomerase [Winogradskyella psychrotolerans]MBU2929843.1 peptidyl-prolyl cis-trans isomerase [Winogradskyella psychrotolerans]
MKHVFTLLILLPLFSFSQASFEKQLDSISTPEEATSFLKENRPAHGKLFTFNKAKHKTRLANDLFNLSKGGKKVIKTDFNKTFYKVIDKDEVNYTKFRIILFNAANSSDEDAIARRKKTLSLYLQGYSFKDLAKHYSYGPTAKMGGDTGWIKAGEISEAFDNIAFNESHPIDEAFMVDDTENKVYYLVLKTENTKSIEEITVLKFTEDIE